MDDMHVMNGMDSEKKARLGTPKCVPILFSYSSSLFPRLLDNGRIRTTTCIGLDAAGFHICAYSILLCTRSHCPVLLYRRGRH